MSLLQTRFIRAFPPKTFIGLYVDVEVRTPRGGSVRIPIQAWMLEDEHAIDECIDVVTEIIKAQEETA